MAEQKRQCSANRHARDAYESWHTQKCENHAVVEREGKWYCRIHDSEYVKAKLAKLQAKWDAEHAANEARWAWSAARDKAVEGLTLEELQQVTPELIRRALSRRGEA